MKSLGIIETVSLTAAVEAADTAVKAANVELVGYELAKGGGYVTVKVIGNVGAVKAALSAAKAAAGKINRVVSCSVIARPDPQIQALIYSGETVGYQAAAPARRPAAPTPSVPKVDVAATPAKAAPAKAAPATAPEPAKPATATPKKAAPKAATNKTSTPAAKRPRTPKSEG